MTTATKNSRSVLPYFVVLGAILILAAIIFLPRFFGGPSIESLKNAALNAESSEVQIRAAQQLGQMGVPALAALREVAGQSDNPGVISVCILAISRERDYEGIDVVLTQLDNDSRAVRASAATALTKFLGRDYHFPVDGSIEERNEIRDLIKADWELYNGSELFEHNKKRF